MLESLINEALAVDNIIAHDLTNWCLHDELSDILVLVESVIIFIFAKV